MAVTLVLNATYEPLCIVPLRRAVVLVLAGKADIVEVRAGYLHSERLAIPSPDVVRLSRYVRIPYRGGAALTRRAVLDRDEHRCAYCQARADTVDHVVPRSRGGRHEWTNVVAACSRCNHRKGQSSAERDRLGLAGAGGPAARSPDPDSRRCPSWWGQRGQRLGRVELGSVPAVHQPSVVRRSRDRHLRGTDCRLTNGITPVPWRRDGHGESNRARFDSHAPRARSEGPAPPSDRDRAAADGDQGERHDEQFGRL